MCSIMGSICTPVAMQWDMYMECGRLINAQAYADNMECMYTSALGDIVDCSEFI